MPPRAQDGRLAVFLLALLALNFPALAVVDALGSGWHLATPTYLFGAWLAVIGIGALLNLRSND